MITSRSATLFKNAQKILPGGVNSPVRAYQSVGGKPLFIQGGKGAYVTDEDNNQYIDYVAAWGPMILGHAHPEVIACIQSAISNGLGFGAPSEIETQLAVKISALIPSIEMLRMVSSGTEATMSAIRVARGFTRRDKIVKFEGCYHGHSDCLLVKAGSGALTLGVPDSLGVPESIARHTLTLEYNNSQAVVDTFNAMGDEIAAIIVEPVAGNMGCIPPMPGFLGTLREVCNKHGSLLIFDEVMSGFRVALGGAQGTYKIKPDITTLGKVIGGGMPVGAFGGRRDIMSLVAPLGGVYQAGTLSGNPLAMAAGLKTLELITAPGFFEALNNKTTRLVSGLKSLAAQQQIAFSANQVGAMFSFFFTNAEPVRHFSQVMRADSGKFTCFFNHLLAAGINLAPSPFESGFVSAAHTLEDIDNTLQAAANAFAKMA